MNSNPRTCRSCGKTLKGRSDKKFCDDYCRNHFNNQLKAPATDYIRVVNSALSRNRKILESILGEQDSCRLTKDCLQEKGFLFQYTTQVVNVKSRTKFFLCYEYGYSTFRNEVEIIRKEKISMYR